MGLYDLKHLSYVKAYYNNQSKIIEVKIKCTNSKRANISKSYEVLDGEAFQIATKTITSMKDRINGKMIFTILSFKI